MIEQFWFYSRGPDYNVEGFESISAGHAAIMQLCGARGRGRQPPYTEPYPP